MLKIFGATVKKSLVDHGTRLLEFVHPYLSLYGVQICLCERPQKGLSVKFIM
jgi:hypothetical protein